MRDWLTKLWGKRETLGDLGERLAADYLRGLGFEIVARQHLSQIGEIDLIARDGDTIVFVEVKTRQSTAAGLPTEAITPHKQRQMTRAALAYLKRHDLLECRARFDVVAIVLSPDGAKPQITHYRNAFEATGSGQMFS
jgi:putative endonuclease